MAIDVRQGSGAVLRALVTAHNQLRAVVATSEGVIHADATSISSGDFQNPTARPALFVAPPATDLTSLLALCDELFGRHAMHVGDTLAHREMDEENVLALAVPQTLADAIAFVNTAKTQWNAHLTQAGIHYTDDGTNAIAAPDATDLPSAITLANAYRTSFAAHIQAALSGSSIRVLPP